MKKILISLIAVMALVFGSFMVASPASAHTGVLTGNAACNSDGTWGVVWTFTASNVPTGREAEVKTLSTSAGTLSKVPGGGVDNGGQVYLSVWSEHQGNVPGAPVRTGNWSDTFSTVGIPAGVNDVTTTVQYDFKGGPSGDPVGQVSNPGNCGNGQADSDKVSLCHATGSSTNPFVLITVAAAGAYHGHLGSGHQDGRDIIPPFVYQNQTYSQNWDAHGQAVFNNGCVEPDKSVPVPAAPGQTDPCGPDNATWNVPASTDSVIWELSEGNGDLLASTRDGYVFDNGTHQINFGQPTDSGKACPQPPVCHDACHIPFVDNNAPVVTRCQGVLSGKVLNNVVVPAGQTCVLVDTFVNGGVITSGARNIYFADTTIRGNVDLAGVTGDVTFGSKGGACRYDPKVGGSILVSHSHNVLVCQASVCKKIALTHNDGKITVRESKARKVVVKRNNRFVADGPSTHANESVIRLFDVTAPKFVVKYNSPRKVVRR